MAEGAAAEGGSARIARSPPPLGAADSAGSETAETTSPPERELAGAALTGMAPKGAALTGHELELLAAAAAVLNNETP